MNSEKTTHNKPASLVTKEISREDAAPENRLQETPSEPFPKETADHLDKEDKKSPEPSKFKAAFKKFWWLVPLLGIVLAIGGVSVMRLREKANQPTTTTQTAPVSVRTATANSELLRAWVSSEGTVRAVDYKHLAFEVEGDVTYLASRGERRLREGDRVRENELLARVDDRELLADLRQAKAALAEAQQGRAATAADVAQAQARVAQYRSQVQRAQAQVERAFSQRNLVQSELERYQQLYNQGVVSASEFDTRQNALEDAEAEIRAVQAEVAAAQEQVRAGQAQVRAAQEQLEASRSQITTAQARLTQAEVALEGASLYAPFDGVVAYLNITEGEYYTPQLVSTQLAGDYQGILERIPIVVIDPSQFEVIVDLASPTGEQVRPGQTALVDSESNINDAATSAADPQTLIDSARARGEVFSVNPAVSPGGRAIQATIRITDQESRLQHGERVLTWIAVEQKPNAVVVPLNAVVFRDRQPYVFVINQGEGTVEQRRVELGITGITEREILQGVSPGELVVTAGQNRLVDGAPVTVIETNQPEP